MRRYQIREKVFALGDDFTIRDERGDEVYRVDGKVLTVRDALHLNDTRGNTLATIRRKLISMRPAYQIERSGRTTTVHKHLFTLLRAKFTVDVPGPDDLEARGSLLEHEYQFTHEDGRVAATVSKRWLSVSDTYGVEVADGEDDVLILAAAIVIDRINHEED